MPGIVLSSIGAGSNGVGGDGGVGVRSGSGGTGGGLFFIFNFRH